MRINGNCLVKYLGSTKDLKTPQKMIKAINSQLVRLQLHNQDDEKKVRHYEQLLFQWNLP